MKKIIAIVLVAAVLVTGGIFAYRYFNPSLEKQLQGAWVLNKKIGNVELGGLNFQEEGKVKVNVVISDIDGTYTVDEENQTVTITYQVLVSVSATYKASIVDDVLTLVDTGITGINLTFNRVADSTAK